MPSRKSDVDAPRMAGILKVGEVGGQGREKLENISGNILEPGLGELGK